MSTEGEIILKAVKQIRQLCEQISQLLSSADGQITKTGWNNESNYAIAEISYSILNPEKWIPIMAFRYYKHKEHPNLLAFVSILLDDEWYREYSIKEPLVTAGFFDYGKSEAGENWDYPYLRCYGYLSKKHDLKADGTSFHFKREMIPPAIQGRFEKLFESGEVFAVPLSWIKNPEDVESQITSKLLQLLNTIK